MDRPIRVIDVPASATTEESERLLNEPYGEGYYLITLTPHMSGMRGYFRQRAKQAKSGEVDAAMELLKAHPGISCRKTAQMLSEHGFRTGRIG